ncbi:TPA: DUF4065 domain-containing protein [Enterococcus faecalis]|uniref:Panacea domain-containing protein n=1 Tax=Enterococcus faecalis TaxID=1351 RepID=UPI000CF35D1E|nr:type II toxin-antitoxin system antitoxin SocA domain-containing protein [Enterococcus faecalis]EGO8594493.1 DUF4065 domain-containing protein [Enterococcus faecalis]EHU9665174.1 DUF4065 domain-containing protein [Enterococcus faecalis]MCL4593429.1 DUF4065 domain-containing protein [Enterococcus faecalis]MDN3086137.1 DUF4065 domain-containing protein [Enterococcus faecalis]NSM42226.1 DUF4065 domain-containing protein [Enterococcus faecalis]
MAEKEVVFDNILTLAKLVKDRSTREMTPLRLQKTLYFIFAFYGATLGQLNSENEAEKKFEGSSDFPKYIFSEKFEAWQYGPVLRCIYTINKRTPEKIDEAESWNPLTEQERAVDELITQVIKQTDEMGDFTLVERSHEDLEWQNAYEDNQREMNKDKIIEEYKASVI